MKPAAIRLLFLLIFWLMPLEMAGQNVDSGPKQGKDFAELFAIAHAGSGCTALPAATGTIVRVSTAAALENAVNAAVAGTTILVADGVYDLNGRYLWFDVPNVTLRSAGGNREAVILDGNYRTTEIVTIAASNVTIADVTLRNAGTHPIHVTVSGNDTLNTLIYNVHLIDPGQQAIKINPNLSAYPNRFPDRGLIACSRMELTDAGRSQVWKINGSCYTGGIDAHQARGWTIRDNSIEGFWCSSDLSEHGIHMWRGCRDTTIERNRLHNNARGIGLGLVTGSGGRTYSDTPCPAVSGYADDWGSTVRNNFVSAAASALFASEYGFDCGICFWNACNAKAWHNTVFTADTAHTFSSLEWRFGNTNAQIINNLVNHTMRQRDGATASQSGNLTNARSAWMANSGAGDLHLTAAAVDVIDRVSAPSGVTEDIDGQSRPIGMASDVGADEYGVEKPQAVRDLRVTEAVIGPETVAVTLRWTPPPGAASAVLRYSPAPILESNWNAAVHLTGVSATSANHVAVLPYIRGKLYFAYKSQNSAGVWSDLSNIASWPVGELFLPAQKR